MQVVPGLIELSECERLNAALRKAINDGISTVHLTSQHSHHVKIIWCDRLWYLTNSELTRCNPQKSLPFVVEGVDERKFPFPYITLSAKEQIGQCTAVYVVRFLQESSVIPVRMFTMNYSHETDSGQVFEAMHPISCDISNARKLSIMPFSQ